MKKLITRICAVLAATCGLTALADIYAWDNHGYDGVSLIGYVRSDTESVDTSERAAAYCLCDDTDPGNHGYTINTLTVKSGDDVRITPNAWHTDWNFANLTVNTLNVGSSGDIKLNVYAGNGMTINAMTGGFSGLTVNGTLNLSDYCTEVDFNGDDAAYFDCADTLPEKNGYTGTCKMGYTIGGTGSVTFLDTAKFKVNGHDATYDAETRRVSVPGEVENADGRVYYIVDGVVEVGDTTGAALVYVGPDGTLDLGTKYGNDNKSALTTLLGKVRGTGVISIGATDLKNLPTDALNSTGCTIKFVGTTCWITQNSTVPFNMILDDYATEGLIIDGANSGASYTFSGTITGNGALAYFQADKGERTSSFIFTGDVSNWTGSFENDNTATSVNVKFQDNTSTTIAAGVINKATSGKLIATYSNSSKLTVTGSLQNESTGSLAVSIPSGKTANFSAVFDDSAITKEGDGTMNIVRNSTSLNHTDGTTFNVSAGTLSFGDMSADSTAPTLGDVSFFVADGATLDNFGWITCSGVMTISNDTAATVFKNGSYAWASPTVEGTGSFVKTGEGTLTLASNFTMDGGVTVSAGTLEIKPTKSASASTFTSLSGTGTLSLPSGTHMLKAYSATPITLGENTSLTAAYTKDNSGNAVFNVTGAGSSSVLTVAPSAGWGFRKDNTTVFKDLTFVSSNATVWISTTGLTCQNVDLVTKSEVTIENGETITFNTISGTANINQAGSGGNIKLTGISTFDAAIGVPVVLAKDATLTCASVNKAVTTDAGDDYYVSKSGNTYSVALVADAGASITSESGTTNYYATFAAAVSAASANGTVKLLKAVDTATTPVTVDKNLTIYIPAEVTLNEADLSISSGVTVTIDGEGTYNLTEKATNVAAALNVTLASTWAGNVTINGGCFNASTNPNNFVIGKQSTVTVNGTKGFIAEGTDVTANIIIGTNNWYITNGYSGKAATPRTQFAVTGSVSGTGDFIVQLGTNYQNVTYPVFVFSGDVSDWTGDVNFPGKGSYKYVYFTNNPVKDGKVSIGCGITAGNVTIYAYITNSVNVTLTGSIDKGAQGAINLVIDAKNVTADVTPVVTSMKLVHDDDKLTVPTALASTVLLKTDVANDDVTEVVGNNSVTYKVTPADVFFVGLTDDSDYHHEYVSLFVNTSTAHPLTEVDPEDGFSYMADYDTESDKDVTFTVVMTDYHNESEIAFATINGTTTNVLTSAEGADGQPVYTLPANSWSGSVTIYTILKTTPEPETPTFPTEWNVPADTPEAVTNAFVTWVGNNENYTAADLNAFLLNVNLADVTDPAQTNLAVTAISISADEGGEVVTITTDQAKLNKANGIVYVLSDEDLENVAAITAKTEITEIIKTDTTRINGGVITIPSTDGATSEFYKVGVGFKLPTRPATEQ